MGAGLGPATAFLYSGPAINALAIILTSKILGFQLGSARAISAVFFSVVIGLIMAFFFRNEEKDKAAKAAHIPVEEPERPLWKTAVFFGLMVGILVFANWGSGGQENGFFASIYGAKWWITSALTLVFGTILWKWFHLSGVRLVVIALGIIAAAVCPRGTPCGRCLSECLGWCG